MKISTVTPFNVQRISKKGMSVLCALIFLCAASSTNAQILWSSSTTGGAWLTAGNWTGSVVPGTTGYAQFQLNPTTTGQVGINMNGSTNNGTNNQAVGGIEVTGSRAVPLVVGNSSTAANGTLTLNGTTINSVSNCILRNNTSQLFTIQDNTAGGNKTMGVALGNATDNVIQIDGSGGITIGSIISGSNKLTKAGTGTGVFTLSGSANTYTGATTANGGTLSFATIANGGSNSSIGASTNAAGNLVLGGGTLQYTGATASTDRNFTLTTGTTSTIDVTTNTLTITGGAASTTGALTKAGSGTLVLTGTNSYTGTTTVSAGTLQLNKTGGATLPSTNDVVINGGTLTVSTNQTLNNVTLASGATLTIASGVTLTINGTFNNNGGTVTTGGGVIAYGAGASLVYGASTQQSVTSTSLSWPTTSGPTNVTINNSASSPAFLFNSSRTLSGNFTVTLGDVQNNSGTGTTLTMSGSSAALSVAGSITGTNVGAGNDINLTYSGTGTLTISGAGSLCRFLNTTISNSTATLILSRTLEVMFGTFTENGTLQINSGGSVSTATNAVSPIYGSSSTLLYNTGGSYGRSGEWTATGVGTIGTTAGYPNNVTLSTSGTNLNLGNGATGTARALNGTLTINSGTTLSMATSAMTAALTVVGNVSNSGTLVLSTSSGGDVNVGGNWTRGSGATLTHNSRAVTFNGTGTQTITVTGGGSITYGYLTINKASGGVTLASSSAVNVANDLTLTSGIIDIAGNDLTVSGSVSAGSSTSYVKTSSTGQLKQTVAGSQITFPVGNSAYDPLKLTNSGTSDTYGVAVVDGTVANAIDATYAVNRAWVVTEAVSGGGNLAVVTQYNTADGAGVNYNGAGTVKLGLYNSSAWTTNSATRAGSNPYTVTSGANFTNSLPTSGSATYFAVGNQNAFAPPAPTVSSFTVTTNGSSTTPNGYTGSTVVITGTNFSGVSAVNIGGTAAASYTVNSSTQITATVATGATGTVDVSNAGGTGSSATNFTYLGYITTQTGGWSTAATWQGGSVPPSNSTTDVTIAHDVTSTPTATTGKLTVNSGVTLSVTSATTLTVSSASTNSGVISVDGTFATAATYTNSGTFNVNNGGTFQINQGGWFTGTAIVYNSTASTLKFNNSSGAYGVSNGDVYWPTSNGPVTVVVGSAGGTVQLQTGASRTITNLTLNNGFDIQSAGLLTLSGTLQINANGYIGSNAPVYLGSSATLTYNTGGSYSTGFEWTGGASTSVAVGTGVPYYVNVNNAGTNVSLSGSRGAAGNVTTSTSTTLNLNAGDLYLAGNFNQNGTLTNNNKAVFFVGGNSQFINSTASSVTFDWVVVNKTGGTSVTLVKAVTINNTLTLTAGYVDIGSNDLTVGATSGGDGSAYVKTSSTGRLKQVVSSSDVFFPVGNSAFNPITLNNSGGTPDTYGVYVTEFTTSPSPAVNDYTKLVQRFWNVNEGTSGGNNLTVKVQWNTSPSEENANFAAGTTNYIGLYSGSWFNLAATSGSGTVANSSTFTTNSATTPGNITAGAYFGAGKDNGFVGTPPTVSSFTVTTNGSSTTPNGYTGSTVVITGTNFGGSTAVTIGGVAAASYTVNSGTQITATVGTGASGNVSVTTPSGSAFTTGFVYLGYITTQTGGWNTGSTWQGGGVPPSSADVTIAHDVTSTPTATVGKLTVNSGVTLTITAATTITVSTASTNSGTIQDNGTFATGVTYTNNGTFNVGNGGNFQLNQGGFLTGSTNPVYDATASTLTFNNSSGVYGVSNGHMYWPATNGPVSVVVTNAGGTVQLQSGATRTVTNLTLNNGFDINAANLLTVNGNLQINQGGFISSNAPIYGSSSTLIYNAPTYTTGTGWTPNFTSGTGVPMNVLVGNGVNTALDFGAATQFRQARGNVTISAGSSLTLSSASGGDLAVGGNLVNNGTFNTNGRQVEFNSSTTAQTFSGITTFDYLKINNTYSTPTVTVPSNVTVNNTLTLTAGLFKLNGFNATAGSTSGGSSTAYVQTNSTGQLKKVVGASNVLFPVGNSAYDPITFNNSGASDTYGVNVLDGAVTTALDQTYAVNRRWQVSEAVAGGSNLAVTPQYNGGEENTNYTSGTTYYVGFYNGTSWTEQTGTKSGSNPYTVASNSNLSPSNLTTGTQYFAVGSNNAFVIGPPTVTSFTVTTNGASTTPNGYTGSTVVITGTNFVSVSSVTIGGTAAASYTVNSSTQITATVGTGATGVVTVTTGTGSGSSATSFTYLGYITTTGATDWTVAASWLGGSVPPTGATTTLAHNIVLNASVPNSPATITINSGIAIDAGSYSITATTSVTNNGTITFSANGSMTTATLTNNGAFTFAGGTGTLNISAGGTLTNNGTFTAVIGTVNFAGAGTLNGTNQITFYNLTINTGVVTLSTVPIIHGRFTINGGSVSASPYYTTNSELYYNTTYTRNVEWGATGVGTLAVSGNSAGATAGYPNNVTVNSGTFTVVNADAGTARAMFGNLVVNTGATFTTGALNAVLTVGGSVTTNGTGAINLSSTNAKMDVAGAVTINSTGSLALSSSVGGDLYVGGNLTNSGTFTHNSRAVYFTGTAQTVSGSFNSTGATNGFAFVRINNGTNVTLGANINVANNITFNSGKITLSTFNLTMSSGATFTTPTSSNYVVTNSTGQLKQVVTTSAILFPVGNSDYNPITLTNAGTSDTYGILVVDAAPPAASVAAKTVQRYWQITEAVAGGGDLTPVVLQYNGTDVGGSYNAGTTPYMGFYNASSWTVKPTTIAGSDPYTATSTGTNQFPATVPAGSYFAIGKDNAFGTASSDYFRSVTTGTWATPGTWESSPDNITWYAATASPTSAANTITIQSAHTVTIDADVTLDQVVVNGTLQVTGATTGVTINDGTGTDITVNTGGTLTMANSGSSGGWTISGSATVSLASGATYVHNSTRGVSAFLTSTSINTTSTVIYRGSSTLTPAFALSGRTYGHLRFESTSGTLLITTNNLTTTCTTNDLYIGSNVTFKASSSSTTASLWAVGGNFTNDGTMDNSVGYHNFQFNGNSKTISGSGTSNFDNISVFGSYTLNQNIAVVSGATLTVQAAGRLDMGTSLITGAGSFTISATTATLGIGHASGITTVASGAVGNVQVTTARTFGTANYVYNGATNQATGNGFGGTAPNTLTINNTGSTGNNIVTLTNSSVSLFSTTNPSLVLTAGKLNIGTGKTLTIASGAGISVAAGADFDATTIANSGTVAFAGTGTVSGTVNFYPAVTIAGGVTFSTATTMQNKLQINTGGFVNTNHVTYATGSTLVYNTGGTYGRRVEWDASSGAGYPYHVIIQNSTTFDPGSLTQTGSNFTNTALNLAGDLTISTGSALYMDFSTDDMNVPLIVNGNLTLSGSLSESNNSGGDVKIRGNFTRTGTFTPNSRAVFFDGTSGNQTMTGATGFDYVIVDNSTGNVVLNNNMTVNQTLTMTNGLIVTGIANKVVANSTVSRTNGWVAGNMQKPRTGAGSATYEIGGTDAYRPVGVTFSSITGSAGDLVVSFQSGPHPTISTSGLAYYINPYWAFTPLNGLTGGTFDGTFNFIAGDVPGGANTANFVVRRNNGSSWSATTAGTRTSTSTMASGLLLGASTVSFAVGEPGTLVVTTQPSNATICQGANASFSSAATQTPSFSTPTVQWQVSTNGGGSYSNVSNGGVYSGATTTTLTITGALASMNGYLYHAVFTDLNGTATSNPATLTVNASVGTPVFTLGATSTRCGGGAGTVTYTATASNNTSLTYSLDATSLGAGNTINSSTGAVTYVGTYTGTAVITATATGCNGPTSATHTVTISNNQWTGTTSTNWSTGSNWSCGTAPVSGENVVIPNTTNKPVLSADVTVGNLNLQSGATITIGANTFTVGGAITGTGTFKGSSSSNLTVSGTGTLNFSQTAGENSLRDLTVSSTGTVTLGNALDVYRVLTSTAGTLNTGDVLTLKSTSILNTARVAPVSGTITGNVTVERFIPAKRAFRFLAPPATTTSMATGSIRDNWMEGTNNPPPAYTGGNFDPNPGYGTHITGSGLASDSMDVTLTNNPSLFTYNNATQNWEAVYNTHGSLKTGSAYRLLVRGSRAVDLSNNAATPDNTVLRTKGTLTTGTVIFNTNSTPALNNTDKFFSFIGNPYASPIDWDQMVANIVTPGPGTAANVEPSYWTWDPNLNVRGAYCAYNAIYGVNQYYDYGTNTSISDVNKYIQSGQSFFVRTNGSNPSLQVLESYKGAVNTFVFRGSSTMTRMSIKLLLNTSGGSRNTADAATVYFDNSFSSSIGKEDVTKFANQDENMSIYSNGLSLSMEGRASVGAGDTVKLKMSQYRQNNYYFSIDAGNFDPSLSAVLKDAYLNTETPVYLGGNTLINFTTTSDAASTSADRFMIVFRPAGTLPVTVTNVRGYQKDRGIQVDWTAQQEINIEHYEVEKSTNGVEFATAANVRATGNSGINQSYGWFDANPVQGNNYYRIKIVERTGAVKYTQIVKVTIGSGASSVSIYPNPVKGTTMNVYFTNMSKGKYAVVLYDNAGRQVYKSSVEHTGGSATYNLSLGKAISKGNYKLYVSDSESEQTESVIIE